jgi:uncharacterized membrane protein HdeD (DUF308 family)
MVRFMHNSITTMEIAMRTFDGIYLRVPGLSLDEATTVLGRRWGWIILAGVAYIALGVVALQMPVASTVGVTIALGGLFTAMGFVHLVHAVKLRREQGGVMRFVQSILSLGAATLIFWSPGLGMLGITLTLGFYFGLSAVVNFMLAQTISPTRARVWIYLNAVASLILGLYILFTFPISAMWIPGTLLGIEFIFNGVGLVGFGLTVRSQHRESKGLKGSSEFWHPKGHTT